MSKWHSLTHKEIKEILLHVSEFIASKEDYLTDLDRECGDGDFGVGMYRGFTLAKQHLENYHGNDIGEIFNKTGYAITSSVGGASGPVFGMLFTTIGNKLRGKNEVTLNEMVDATRSAAETIMRLGGARVGDKTMIDALIPAVEALEESVKLGDSIITAFKKAAEAAGKGAEATKNMIAKKGKASYLGEKTLGHPDPGATAVALIFQAFSEKLEKSLVS